MCGTESYSSHKNLSFQTFLDCYQILTELRLFLGRFNLSQADRPRYTGGPSAPASLVIQLLRCTGVGLTEAYRTVRGYLADRLRLHSGHIISVTEVYQCIWRTVHGTWADCPCCNFLLIRASSEKLHEWQTVRLLHTDCLHYQISDSLEFRQLSQFQLWIGIIAQITFQKSQKLAWTPSKDSYEWVRIINQK